tara:strand:- start:203 stop:1192 length:990 start_codon:yes stop_codon:yes gene_type:complete
MRFLKKNTRYSRLEVFDIFNPKKPFDQIWKQWGIIKLEKYIDELKDDFIFFLTLGSEQAGHSFDEGISQNGILSWQSQPQNSFRSPNIQKFINHSELLNNIYFFYRENQDENYLYLGKLRYISHDRDREKPVYFQWQIIDWDENTYIKTTKKPQTTNLNDNLNSNSLNEIEPPKFNFKKGVPTSEFRTVKNIDYSTLDKSNKELGINGEKLVLDFEKKKLIGFNRNDLADKVSHDSVKIGDGLGYDIQSYDSDGNKIFIEVKTTRGNIKTPFFVTPNELKRSKIEKNFYLYRVFDYNKLKNNGQLYVERGPLDESFRFIPSEYKAFITR